MPIESSATELTEQSVKQSTSQLDLFHDMDGAGMWRVRRSKRARSMAIHVRHVDDIEVVVPMAATPAAVAGFVASQRDWIRRACAALSEQGPPPDLRLPNCIDLPLCGQSWVINYNQSVGRKGWRDDGHSVAVAAPQNARRRGRLALRSWLQHKGREVLVPMLRARAASMRMPYRKVQVRGQKTRWGSYSSSGTVSLNYCLLFTPPDLADYLLVHELCHSQHMNHSRAYWALVRSFAPNYRKQEARLNDVRRYVPDWLRLD
ncbi:MAG: SprT family zinc-dependent metalloprotease [Pseudomonadota bacterium]